MIAGLVVGVTVLVVGAAYMLLWRETKESRRVRHSRPSRRQQQRSPAVSSSARQAGSVGQAGQLEIAPLPAVPGDTLSGPRSSAVIKHSDIDGQLNSRGDSKAQLAAAAHHQGGFRNPALAPMET